MSVILSSMLLVFGSYIAQPEWFDNGPFEFVEHYESVEECQIASHGTGDICVGEPSLDRYMKSNVESAVSSAVSSEELNFIQCDYWAGCYLGDR